MGGHVTCTRLLAFDAAHRVVGHEGKCKDLHGHRYTAEITCAGTQLDALGRVIDFGVVKERIGGWIDQHWDHTVILWQSDATLANAIAEVTRQRIFLLPDNPTAENMAKYLLEVVCPREMKDTGIRCVRVRVWETPNCYAECNA
jgi:6-pyruvoyltetrahydropterin/6-carboxytetrahydropterin synthase